MHGADVQPAAWIAPLAARPVGVDLYAVALGVVEVQGLADEVVGGPGEGQPFLQGALQKPAELLLGRQQDGEVIEAGRVSRSLLPVGQGGQAKDRGISGGEDRVRRVATGPRQPKPLVELRLALEVENLELGRSERPVSGVQYQ